MSKKHRRSGKHGSGDNAGAGHRAEAPAAEGGAARTRGAHLLDNWLLGLAVAGIALTSYLTFVAWFGAHPAFCGADSECDLVQQSRWSTLLGQPIALWGLVTYALLARLIWRLRTRAASWRMALTIAVIGAAVSWYLTAVSVFVIEATCAYCLASFGIANALLVLLLVRRPALVSENAWAKSLPLPVGAAVVIVFGLFLNFSGLFNPAAGPEKPYLKALAVHLRASGARFYGAYWCPTCQKQKELFEASVDRLPYVECSPDGRRGVANFDCVANDIKDYPTWIISGRRYTGLISADQLATLSKFKPPAEGVR
ncbi:MAG: vitamin K epoxide reductase family protein [Burkholderiales bacterium]